jgi:hypothetical protein
MCPGRARYRKRQPRAVSHQAGRRAPLALCLLSFPEDIPGEETICYNRASCCDCKKHQVSLLYLPTNKGGRAEMQKVQK